MEFTHFDPGGKAWMVDVSGKEDTRREAVAEGTIRMNRECFERVARGSIEKGDVLGAARIAGIMGAKKTAELIPLCHILNLTKLSVDFDLLPEDCAVRAVCTAGTVGKTGAEMEALTGVSCALLTVYDMCKAVDKAMEIGEIRLLRKSGGKSTFQRNGSSEELDSLPLTGSETHDGKLRVRCFGYFEVFWKNEPLLFARKKTKELFAVLVVRKGSASSAEELISILYENTEPEDMKKAKQNLRNLIFDLTETLEKIGQRDILLRKGSSIAVYPEKLDCDYYRLLAEGQQASDMYSGEFMEQYSWAESARGTIGTAGKLISDD